MPARQPVWRTTGLGSATYARIGHVRNIPMTLLDKPAAVIEFQTYEEVRAALFNSDLSRSFDKRSFAEGNIRDGVVSISHGATHRARRRLENTQFRPDRLREYERQ